MKEQNGDSKMNKTVIFLSLLLATSLTANANFYSIGKKFYVKDNKIFYNMKKYTPGSRNNLETWRSIECGRYYKYSEPLVQAVNKIQPIFDRYKEKPDADRLSRLILTIESSLKIARLQTSNVDGYLRVK